MSKTVVESVIKRFVETPTPQVIAVTGPWGVGKTFALKSLLEGYRGNPAVHRYAYTSIFGAQSTGEIRTSLLSRRQSFPFLDDAELAAAPSKQRLLASFNRKRSQIADKANFKQAYDSLREAAPWGGKHILVAAETLAGSLVSDMLVVLDDIERIGERLSFEHFLGLVTELRDQQRCKVILVFNEDGFKKEHRATYERYAEKVVDQQLRYRLDEADAAAIGIAADTPNRDLLVATCAGLRINNIRVLQRIETAMKLITPVIADLSPSIQHQLAVTVPVFACSIYERARGFPEPETMLKFSAYKRPMQAPARSSAEPPDTSNEWAELLDSVGFMNADDFDAAVMEIMQRGYVEGSLVRLLAEDLDRTAHREEKTQVFRDAWSMFRDRIDMQSEEVVKSFVDAIASAADAIGPHDLDATVRLLRRLGFDSEANSVIDLYIEQRKSTPKIFEVAPDNPLGAIVDPILKERLLDAHHKLGATLTLEDAAMLVLKNDEWDHGIPHAFQHATAADLVAIFEKFQGPSLRSLITGIIRLPIPEEVRTPIMTVLFDALRLIAERSELNRIRIKHWGYDIDSLAPSAQVRAPEKAPGQ